MRKLSNHSKNSIRKARFENMQVKYIVEHRDIKYPRLEFHSDVLSLILPKHMKDEKKILKSKGRWIKEKYLIIKENSKVKGDLLNKFSIFGNFYRVKDNLRIKNFEIRPHVKEIRMNSQKHLKLFKKHLKVLLKNKITSIIDEFSDERDVKFNKIFIRTQKTKWASCSLKRNLSFNLKLISLPNRLLKYVVFHELLHLKERKHDYNFTKLIKQKFKNFKQLEKKLFRYWFILDKNKIWKKFVVNM